MGCDTLCSRFSDIPDAQGKQDLLKRHVDRLLKTFQETVGRLLLPVFKTEQLCLVKAVEIRRSPDQSEIVHLKHRRISSNHIHRLAAQEVHQPRLNLRRASCLIGAESLCFLLIANKGSSAIRADGREEWKPCICRAFRKLDSGYFRNDFSTFFHIYIISDAHIKQPHLILIMQ